MSVGLYSLDEKLAALDVEIKEARQGRREPGSALHRHYEILKSIAADLRARQQFSRNNTLGQIERQMGYVNRDRSDQMRFVELARIVANRWPVISQALEAYGEESAE